MPTRRDYDTGALVSSRFEKDTMTFRVGRMKCLSGSRNLRGVVEHLAVDVQPAFLGQRAL